ncbi:MAG: DUF1134 domain-containing protein [Gammaproteobacteria bacterium]|nr:DUF1134 domain-containing protein [Gammaproteobacteria bacterium]
MSALFAYKKLITSLFTCLLMSAMFMTSGIAAEKGKNKGFDHKAIVKEAAEFLGVTSEEIAKVLAKTFEEHGKPNAYIKGEETAGALGVGVRFGTGELHTVDGQTRQLEWDGPSIGFDLGLNTSKVLMLIYHLDSPDDIFKRFPGVEGSVYLVAGIGINYMKSGSTIIAPVRVGVGWRHGANVGFIDFKDKQKKSSI